MKLKSFGCSFIYGTDLSDDDGYGGPFSYSRLSWPALMAKELNAEYHCYARAGAGNLFILERLLDSIESNSEDAFYVVGWTYIDRFDYISTDVESVEALDLANPWQAWKYWQALRPGSDGDKEMFYYRNLHSESADKLKNLIYIETAINTLKKKNIPFLMTYQDDLLLDTTWHSPPSVTYLQNQIKSHLHNFEGKTFVSWSQSRGFDISKTLHPLDLAHSAAAELMLPIAKKILNR